ncbi:hypothetical protein WJX81_001271 [Elliptochloris bilobata]|uniref:Uncharacterized protein n=1 Tax=Elliptochloris bilobata TaxID=381761 RepID=A0AAW1S0J1_9CHLO
MTGSRPVSEGSSSSDSEGPALPARAEPSGVAAPAHDAQAVATTGREARAASSHSSESEDSDARRRRRRREKQRSREKGLKVKKSGSKDKKRKDKKRKKEDKKSRKDKGPVQLSKFLERGEGSGGAKYSAVSGKKIKLKVEKTKADKEAERNRKHLLAVLNASYD